MACGGNSSPTAGASQAQRSATSASSVPPSPIERKGDIEGRLIVTPRAAKPGGELRVSVQNLGRVTITYGLPNRPQRRVNGRWRDATKEIYGTSLPGFGRVAINVAPGKTRRFKADRIKLPRTVEPGTYRIRKRVGIGPEDSNRDVTFKATFVVR